jgi:hypothetical protein
VALKHKGRMSEERLQRLIAEGRVGKDLEAEIRGDRWMENQRVNKVHRDRDARVREGARQARVALSDDEVRQRLRFTEEDIEALNETILKPQRHAGDKLGGLKLKAMINGLLEKQLGSDGGVKVTVTVIPPGPIEGVGGAVVTGAVESGRVAGVLGGGDEEDGDAE